MLTLLHDRHHVGIRCALAVRDGIEQYGGPSPARRLCASFPDIALGSAIYFLRPRGWQQGAVDEQYAFERGFGMITLLYDRQLVGARCAKAVCGGIWQ